MRSGDANPTVRASAATSLGQIGDPAARDPLARAQQDPSPMVRRTAEKALRELPEPNRRAAPPATVGRHVRPAFEVKAMGDRSHHAGPALRQHMRDVLTAELAPVGDVAARPPTRRWATSSTGSSRTCRSRCTPTASRSPARSSW